MKKSTKKKIQKISIITLSALLFLVLVLNIYGRSHYDPSGKTESIISIQDLKPGKNIAEFLSNGDKISAFLFIPEDYVKGEKRPAIVITPPHTGVKEQTAGIYAEKLSEKGFITLVFDPRGFGESEGHKGLLSTYRQTEDLKNSVDYLLTLEQVDKENIFSLGMCAGSGVAAYETIEDSRIKALAVVSPYLTGSESNGGDSFIIMNMFYIINGVSKVQHALAGSEVYRPLVPTTEEDAEDVAPITKGMMTYYLPGKPGDVATWNNDLSLFSFVPVLDFSIFDYPDQFDSIPVYVVYGTEAVSKDGAIRFYDMVNGPKDRLVISDAGHFDIYWKPEYVDPAVDGIADFLNKYVEVE